MPYTLNLTTHARKRIQQRGITEEAIATVLYYGERFHAGAGVRAYFMSRRAIHRAHSQWNMDLGSFRDVAVIVSPDEQVVTVQYCPAPKKSWTGRH